MNWLEIQQSANRRLGDLPSSDSFISVITAYCNDAQDYLVLRRLDGKEEIEKKFPELRKAWTGSIQTVDGDDTYTLPADLLILKDIFSLDTTAETTASSTAKPVKLDLIEDDTEFWEDSRSSEGYPRKYILKDDDEISILPVPAAGYEANLIITGLKQPTACPSSNPQNSSPDLDSRWHMAIVDCIVYLIADHRGWTQMAAEALSQLDRRLKQQAFPEAEHKKRHATRVKFRGSR